MKLLLVVVLIFNFMITSAFAADSGEVISKDGVCEAVTDNSNDETFTEDNKESSESKSDTALPDDSKEPSDGFTYEPEITAEFNGHTYSLFFGTLTWEEAREYCMKIGGHLATITSQEEHNFVSTLDNGEYHSVWIGGYRDSSFVWYWVTDEEWSYTNWQYGEPNNSYNVVGNEYCVALWPDQWNDLNSDNIYEQYGFICEWDELADDGQGVPDGLDKPVDEKVSPISVVTYNGHTYKLFDDTLKWTEARAYCESIGGHLATITDEEENELLTNLAENGGNDTYWIGAGGIGGDWMWITQEEFYYSNFSKSHSDELEDMRYLQLTNIPTETEKRGEWLAKSNDISYTSEDGKTVTASYVGFICEWDSFIVENENITAVNIDSKDNKISIDLDFNESPGAFAFAALYSDSFTSPKSIDEESGVVEFDEVEGDKKYTVKMFFWDEDMRPFSKPVETEIFVK